MKKKHSLFTIMAICLMISLQATILPVPGSYPTIQEAINAAIDGDTILVDQGTYFENLNFRGKGIILASQFIFTDDLTDIANTVIDGSQPVDPDSASCIIIAKSDLTASTDTLAAVIGFTITNGTGTVWEDEHGPGSFYREGGGILIQYDSPRIRFNRFISNDASNDQGIVSAGGGGIRCGDGDPEISNNIFLGNTAKYGGGLVLNYSGAVIRNNLFTGNSGGQDYGGGGLWIVGNDGLSRPRIVVNNTIINNSSTTQGGGLLLWSTVISIRNNIIWGNTASQGPQLHKKGGATVTVEYCDVMGGYTGMGNIDMDPAFNDTAYIPQLLSPCVDAGDSTIIYNDPENPQSSGNALYPARNTLRNDIGAYGGPGSKFLDSFLTVGIYSPPVNRSSTDRLHIFPNPAKKEVTIGFVSGREASGTVRIIQLNGQQLVAFPTTITRGDNSRKLSLSEINNGCYMVVVEGGNFRQSGMLFIAN